MLEALKRFANKKTDGKHLTEILNVVPKDIQYYFFQTQQRWVPKMLERTTLGIVPYIGLT